MSSEHHVESFMSEMQATFALLGNVFLTSANLLPTHEIAHRSFWEALPSEVCMLQGAVQEASDQLTCAHQELLNVVSSYEQQYQTEEEILMRWGVEYTHLFIGPPSPAVAPWETMHTPGNTSVGFGEATVDMKHRLSRKGLTLASGKHQYEDHIGIELLYASELLGEISQTADEQNAFTQQVEARKAWVEFCDARLWWMSDFSVQLKQSFPEGFYAALARYTHALIRGIYQCFTSSDDSH